MFSALPQYLDAICFLSSSETSSWLYGCTAIFICPTYTILQNFNGPAFKVSGSTDVFSSAYFYASFRQSSPSLQERTAATRPTTFQTACASKNPFYLLSLHILLILLFLLSLYIRIVLRPSPTRNSTPPSRAPSPPSPSSPAIQTSIQSRT